MKKILIMLFLFLMMGGCYLIYNLTSRNGYYYMSMGDSLSRNMYINRMDNVICYDTSFVNSDYRVVDLLNVIRYNEEISVDGKMVSVHQILKRSDVVILAVGMNDIYFKLNDNTKNIYSYINEMINNMELLLDEINRYDYKYVFVLGYYNIMDGYDDIFVYLNYKLERVTIKNNYTYIDTYGVINDKKYLNGENSYYLNEDGYEKIIKLIVDNLEKS